MANSWINLYKNATGNTDGTVISTGNGDSPLMFTLDAANNEVSTLAAAIRCESGFYTSTDTTISAVSDTANHWALSLDGTNWSDTIIIASTISTVNSTFYVKASASDNEVPKTDTGTKLRVQTKIAAVS